MAVVIASHARVEVEKRRRLAKRSPKCRRPSRPRPLPRRPLRRRRSRRRSNRPVAPVRLIREQRAERQHRCDGVDAWQDFVSSSAWAIPAPNTPEPGITPGSGLLTPSRKRPASRFGLESKLHGETAKIQIGGQTVWLLKPATFMNLSGRSVAAALALLEDRAGGMPDRARRARSGAGHRAPEVRWRPRRPEWLARHHAACSGTAGSTACGSASATPGTRTRSRPGCLGGRARTMKPRSLRAIDEAIAVLPLAVAGDFNEAMKQLHTPKDR